MLLMGLTGSIATGKSTVSSLLFSLYSIPIIDADLLARRVIEPGTRGYQAIVSHFGTSMADLLVSSGPDMPENGLTGMGRPLNRQALGRHVFGDDPGVRADRAVLNAIVHPAVRKAMARAVLRYYVSGHRVVVLDVPLLFESGLDRLCGTVMVVAVRDPAIQRARLMARDLHLTAEDAENRIQSQGDAGDKARWCESRGKGRGVVIWNDGGSEELRSLVERAMSEIHKASPRWWNWLLWVCPPIAVVAAIWVVLQNQRANKQWEEKERQEKAKL